MPKKITVFTPAYNRAHLLPRLYDSLKAQTNKDFLWLIVDDGSDDKTHEVVEGFARENEVEIVYIYQENGGKYVAHNTGVKECSTELFVCVDSDDYLYPHAIERTLAFWEAVKSDAQIGGIVSPKDMNGTSYFRDPPKKSTLMDLYEHNQLVGETMLVFRTEALRQFLFPEVKGEKFMSEVVIYHQVDQKYLLATQNEYLYKGEYQGDGLTLNIDKVHWRNPRTTLIMHLAIAAYQKNFVTAAKAYAAYLAWKKIQSLPPCNLFPVRKSVSLCGALLQGHYLKLFQKKKESMK